MYHFAGLYDVETRRRPSTVGTWRALCTFYLAAPFTGVETPQVSHPGLLCFSFILVRLSPGNSLLGLGSSVLSCSCSDLTAVDSGELGPGSSTVLLLFPRLLRATRRHVGEWLGSPAVNAFLSSRLGQWALGRSLSLADCPAVDTAFISKVL